MPEHEYENTRRIQYNFGGGIGLAIFVPVCITCARFVKADEKLFANDWNGLKKQPNATCSKCGRTEMLFEGFF